MILSTALAGLGAATSLGSAVYGAIQSNKKNKQAQAIISGMKNENQRWYDSRTASDYTRRSDSQAILEKQRKMYDDQLRQSRATNAVAGGTNEAVAAQQSAAANGVAETMSGLASAGAKYKDSVESQYMSTNNNLTSQQAGIKAQEAANVAQAAGQGVSAGLNLIGVGAKLASSDYSPTTTDNTKTEETKE